VKVTAVFLLAESLEDTGIATVITLHQTCG